MASKLREAGRPASVVKDPELKLDRRTRSLGGGTQKTRFPQTHSVTIKHWELGGVFVFLLEGSCQEATTPSRKQTTRGARRAGGAHTCLTDSEVGQLREVVPGTRHFHKIIQHVHGVKLQAFGLVHSAQNVLWVQKRAHG